MHYSLGLQMQDQDYFATALEHHGCNYTARGL